MPKSSDSSNQADALVTWFEDAAIRRQLRGVSSSSDYVRMALSGIGCFLFVLLLAVGALNIRGMPFELWHIGLGTIAGGTCGLIGYHIQFFRRCRCVLQGRQLVKGINLLVADSIEIKPTTSVDIVPIESHRMNVVVVIRSSNRIIRFGFSDEEIAERVASAIVAVRDAIAE